MDGDTHHGDDIAKSKNPGQPDQCSICLEPISQRAVANPCNHLTFDFICLVSWLQERATCPLCKHEITEVQYDWASPVEYKTYRVRQETKRIATTERLRPRPRPRPAPTDASLARRMEIYRHRLYAQHVGSNASSGYTPSFTPHDFAHSQPLQSRTRMFLRRELQVFAFLDGRRDFLIEYIVAVLRNHELRGAEGKAEELVGEFVGQENARQVIHELETWLRSPFAALREWDEEVQYAPAPQTKTRSSS